jgi:type II secretory pathway pseudopilin PulG
MPGNRSLHSRKVRTTSLPRRRPGLLIGISAAASLRGQPQLPVRGMITATRTRFGNEGGFTLLEATVAMLILGFVLTSVLAIASHCTNYLNDIRRTARSSQVLQQKMEDIRLLSWSQLQALPTTFTDPNDTEGIYSGTIVKSAYDTYAGTTTVMKVTLLVTWRGRNGKILTNSLTTLISNGGLNKYIF